MILAADSLHGLRATVSDAMKRLDPEPIRELARRCEQSGAELIDINPGYLSRRNEDRMEFLVETVQNVTDKRLILDSPNPRLLARGLAVCRETPILNALSLEQAKLDGILPLAVEYKTPLVLLLMDERSFTPSDIEEKSAVAIELRERAIAAGLTHDDLIFDPVLPNLMWDDARPRLIQSIRTIRMLASGALFQEETRTMAGLSNLRSGGGDRFPWEMEETALKVSAGAGLSILLADALNPNVVRAFEDSAQMV